MTQIHKKYTVDQIIILLTSYQQGHITRSEIENTLGIGKTRFFALLKKFKPSRMHFRSITSEPVKLA
jgi:hypothetical protein